jgi:hypothetical protein
VANRSKIKGTKAETAVVKWFIENGYLDAERIPLAGADDHGDVRPVRGLVVQVKDGYTNGREPSDRLIRDWMQDLAMQRVNGGHSLGLLVHKRPGKGSPADWRWYINGNAYSKALGGSLLWIPYIQLTGGAVLRFLDWCGWKPTQSGRDESSSNSESRSQTTTDGDQSAAPSMATAMHRPPSMVAVPSSTATPAE